jgi:hypothetical protein
MVLMMSGNLVARVGHAHGDLSGKCRWAREERRKKIQREETDYCKASMRERERERERERLLQKNSICLHSSSYMVHEDCRGHAH